MKELIEYKGSAERLLKEEFGFVEKFRREQSLIDSLSGQSAYPESLDGLIGQYSCSKALADIFETLNRQSRIYEETLAHLASPDMERQIKALTKSADYSHLFSGTGLLPNTHCISDIAESLAEQVQLFKSASMTETTWSNLLQKQMAAVQIPWLNPYLPSLSFEGFAVVSRLGQAVRYSEPFDQFARHQMDEDLGGPINIDHDTGPEEWDAALIEANINPSIMAISRGAVNEVLIHTGFSLRTNFTPLPPTTDGTDPGHKYHPQLYMLLTSVEQNLRKTIETRMQAQYGSTWMKTRINKRLIDEWKIRRSKAVANGESPMELIQYSDFMDLNKIIVQRQHWDMVFKTVFRRKDDFQTSMERLSPIRNSLGHCRPIGFAQQLHLISEASHILRALGINIFSSEPDLQLDSN